ncbi:uncharacterized protein LOC129302442 isoform X2 [Prosopis cineraria]|uniref:uncharacterized protein LOC129302442 isoform X2 n=1 Tax=Prosopis cineraria TaxID=364024 RepID=UPI0024105C52|nr:uncharacterized protein LOC129302442 isoform X2 [Prosopis cineraria]
MAYRRRQQATSRPSAAFEEFADEGIRNPPPPSSFEALSSDIDGSFTSSPSSLAAKAIRASSARRDSSLSSAYRHSNLPTAPPVAQPPTTSPVSSKDSRVYEYTSMKTLNESKHGFWGSLARKAKSIIEDEQATLHSKAPERMEPQMPGAASGGKFQNSNNSDESSLKRDNPKLLKGFDALTSSLSNIGSTIGNALEEGFTIVENRTSGIIQETRNHIKKKPGSSELQRQEANPSATRQHSQSRTQKQTDQELQLKASRDVAMAMAAKAKLLLRELKTVKADLAFAKERCAQLEEENKILRESRERGDNPEDDDMIRLQLETLLAEKARLAHENSVFARENRFLREVVEYHQLTMQDVVYFDESNEEVTEVNPLNLPPGPPIQPDDSIASSVTTPSLSSPAAISVNAAKSTELARSLSPPIPGKEVKTSELTRTRSSSPGMDHPK